MPPGVLTRFADNVKGILAIADSCGEEWEPRPRGGRGPARQRKRRNARKSIMIRHGLLIFEIYELDRSAACGSTRSCSGSTCPMRVDPIPGRERR